MNTKNFKKFVIFFLFCAIVASNAVKASAEDINVEKINFELGVGCLTNNDLKQAIKYFTLIIQENPNNIEAHYNLALAYKKSGMTEKSVSEFDRIVKLLNAPQNFKAKHIDINKLREENRILHDNEFAYSGYDLYSKVKSQENDYIDLADMHYDNQQYETAVEYYNLALQINPYNDYTYFKIAKTYIDKKKYIQAEPYISKAVELKPQNPKYTFYKDLVTKNIGNAHVKSSVILENIVKQPLNKKDPMEGYDLPNDNKKEDNFVDESPEKETIPGTYFTEVKNLNKPELQAETSSSKPKLIFGKKQNIKITENDKKPEISIDGQKNLPHGKSQELDYLDLADLHYDNQEYDTAIEYYNLAISINPNNDYSYYKLARCYIDMKQFKDADKSINKALELSSMNKEYLYFKNQISSNLFPEENKTLAYKAPESKKRNKVVSSRDVNINLNPHLKMIAEDPGNSSNADLLTDSDDADLKSQPDNPVKKETKGLKALLSRLIPDFSKSAEDNQDKNTKNDVSNKKIADKTEKTKRIAKNAEISGQKISSVETNPSNVNKSSTAKPDSDVNDSTSQSIFGKDMKYYEVSEPEQPKAADYEYEKPMQSQVKDPEFTPDYYNEKGIEYFRRDNLSKAENFFKKAIELKPMYAKAYNNLANVEVKRANLDKAIEYGLRAVEIDSGYPESYYNLALIYKRQKDSVNELSYLDKAIEVDPKFYEAYFTKGLYYYNTGDYEQAKVNFKEVLNLKNDYYLAAQNLGIMYANELNQKEAETYFKIAIRLNKNNPTPYYYLASIYQTMGNVFDAMENYQKTIELDPANYKALLALSRCYEQNDEIDRAIDTLKDAIQLNPSNAEPYNYLGLLYLKKDKYIEATNSFQKAIEINPKRAVYHYNLSQSYICLNMKTKASMEFEKAVNTSPASIQDYIDLSEIFADRSMPSYSIKMLKDGIAALPDSDYLYIVLSGVYERTGAINAAKQLLNEYLVKKPNGTLSLLIQRKLNSMENSDKDEN